MKVFGSRATSSLTRCRLLALGEAAAEQGSGVEPEAQLYTPVTAGQPSRSRGSTVSCGPPIGSSLGLGGGLRLRGFLSESRQQGRDILEIAVAAGFAL
jgi:hypothetical protein